MRNLSIKKIFGNRVLLLTAMVLFHANPAAAFSGEEGLFGEDGLIYEDLFLNVDGSSESVGDILLFMPDDPADLETAPAPDETGGEEDNGWFLDSPAIGELEDPLIVDRLPETGEMLVLEEEPVSEADLFEMEIGEVPEDLKEEPNEQNVNSGKWGSNIYWKVEDGTLILSGTGDMDSINSPTSVPGWYNVRDSIQTVVIQEGITSIANECFLDCTSLTNVIFPESSLLGIYYNAFQNCTSLTQMVLPDGLTEVFNDAFCGCTSLAYVFIPDSVMTIIHPFRSCPALQTAGPAGGGYDIEFEWTDVIPSFAFAESSLLECVLPEGITQIQWDAFHSAQKLNQIVLPSTLTTIRDNAFLGSDCLRSVSIPAAVTEIGDYAFGWCEEPKEITFEGNAPLFLMDNYQKRNTFYGGNVTIRYPADASGWLEARGLDFNNAVISWITCVEGEIPLQLLSSPENQILPAGETAVFSVDVNGPEHFYQWQYSKDGGATWNNCSGSSWTSSYSIEAINARNQFHYRCIVTDEHGSLLTSGEAVLMIRPELISSPESQTLFCGDTVHLKVSATGVGLRYQWQLLQLFESGERWMDVSGKGPDYALKVNSFHNGCKYRCVITDANGIQLISDTASLTVNGVEMTRQPASVVCYVGDRAQFLVSANGTGLTYQWYYSKDGGVVWNEASSRSASYTIRSVNAAQNGFLYYCRIEDSSGAYLNTDIVSLTILPKITENIQWQQGRSVGANLILKVQATGAGLRFQWQYRKPGSESWVNASSTKNTYSIKVQALHHLFQYRCVVTDASGMTLTSHTAELSVSAGDMISVQPSSVNVDEGEKATFQITASGVGLTYQWQFYKPGGGYWFDASSKTPVYSITAGKVHNEFKYRCKVSDRYGRIAYSESALLTVNKKTPSEDIAILKQPSSVTVSVGEKAQFTVIAEGTNLKYQWQYSRNGGVTWSNASSNTNVYQTVEVWKLHNGFQYRCLITVPGDFVYTVPATLTVN